MVAEKIKHLREQQGLTQAELSKRLGITRSSVNAWEMGISVPSTQYLVALADLFRVSTDYLLGVERSAVMDLSGLTQRGTGRVYALVEHLRAKNSGEG